MKLKKEWIVTWLLKKDIQSMKEQLGQFQESMESLGQASQDAGSKFQEGALPQ